LNIMHGKVSTGQPGWSIHTIIPWICVFIVAVLGPLTVTYYKDAYGQVKIMYDDNVEMVKEHKHFIEHYVNSMKQQTNTITNEDKLAWSQRDAAFLNRIEVLQQRIQKESRREVIERFGGGTHEVEFEVVLPTNPMQPYYFRIQTAPLYLMPHSVHLFLEQVENGLWDGCTFTTNDKHVILAEPSSLLYDHDRLPLFEAAELDTVAFQEYADDFPHDKYTVGFAGRPGGPAFYINKMENSAVHGIPQDGGLDFIEADPDPCFAMVVRGQDVIKQMSELGVKDGRLLKERVLIKKVTRIQRAKIKTASRSVPEV